MDVFLMCRFFFKFLPLLYGRCAHAKYLVRFFDCISIVEEFYTA